VLALDAQAAEASWHGAGRVGALRLQAGKDTSAAFARKVANRLIMRNSCEHIPYRITSPTTRRAYRLRCITIHRPGMRYGCQSCGWTVITWGGPGDNGSTIRVRVWFPGQVN
jgi:hypothetical protein